MKFVCDRCGKKYATADDPAPGKVYKLKCKACGHLIVVRAQAGTSTALPAVTSAEASPLAQAPEIELSIEPEPSPPARPSPASDQVDDAVIMDAPLPPEVASAIDGVAPVPSPPPRPAAGLEPPPPDKDELADFTAAAAEVMAAPAGAAGGAYVDLFADGVTGESKVGGKPGKPDDPFVAAARASLPEGYLGSGGPDPFAPPPAELPRPPAAPARPDAKPVAKPPARPQVVAKGGGLPLGLIGGGVVVLLVIAAVAVMRGGKKPEQAPEPVVAARAERPVPAPAPAPPPPPVPEPAPEPAKAVPAPVPAPKVEARPVAVERKPEPRPAPRPAPRPEPPRVAAAAPEPRPAPPPPAPVPEEKPDPRTETREVTLPDAEAALTPEVVQKVIGANRKAFASCIAASAGTGVQLDGRKVALRLTVNSNGAVTYPTLDDVTLNSTEMGQCLKSAARLMIFPKFKGDPFHVEVPLTLSGN